ncbi:MAG: DUF1826 domain-containing protein [Gammaproteobacteria bacterium]
MLSTRIEVKSDDDRVSVKISNNSTSSSSTTQTPLTFAGIFKANRLARLKNFPDSGDHLAIIEREKPADSEDFFEKLYSEYAFEYISGKVRKSFAKEDISFLLDDSLAQMQGEDFYELWLIDMADICKIFCDIQKTDEVAFWLGSDRGCTRYHVDNVNYRLLVTYDGKGTQWLPEGAADRDALKNLEPNENILKDESAVQFINEWDVAIFRGGEGAEDNGVVHRTPDEALENPSILMRLDHPKFLWDMEDSDDFEESDCESDEAHPIRNGCC